MQSCVKEVKALQLTSIMLKLSLYEILSKSPTIPNPAQFTSIFTSGCILFSSCTSGNNAFLELKSAIKFLVFVCIFFFVFANSSSFLPTSQYSSIECNFLSNCNANSLPIPEDAPVIITILIHCLQSAQFPAL